MKANKLVVCGIIICLFVLAIALLVFAWNNLRISDSIVGAYQSIFGSSSSGSPSVTPSGSPSSTPSGTPTVPPPNLDQLKTIFEIQKQSSASDILSFLYTFLSTALIGTGMYFLLKIQESAAEAKRLMNETSKKVEDLGLKIEKADLEVDDNYKRIHELNRTLISSQNTYEIEQYLTGADYLSHVIDILSLLSSDNVSIDRLYSYIPKLRDTLTLLHKKIQNTSKIGINISDKKKQFFLLTLQMIRDRFANDKKICPEVFDDNLTEDLTSRCSKCIAILECIETTDEENSYINASPRTRHYHYKKKS